MKRREVELERDYDRLLEMQRLSWAINFPDYGFNADAFRVSLRSGVRRHEVYVYEEDDEMVGWLWLDTTSSSTSGHIKHIQVEQAHWGRAWASYPGGCDRHVSGCGVARSDTQCDQVQRAGDEPLRPHGVRRHGRGSGPTAYAAGFAQAWSAGRASGQCGRKRPSGGCGDAESP